MSLNSNSRMAFLGCSQGLGRAVALQSPEGERLFLARSKENLMSLAKEVKGEVVCIDFSGPSDELVAVLDRFCPTHIYYFAGGGPFGAYHEKSFKDHEWAFNVSFKTPARLIHWSLRENIQQFVVVGSAIAESSGDIKAGSYAASKHALLGLCQSIWLESEHFDLRLFSPGYMDTELLPLNARPRKLGIELGDPKELAGVFWNWVLTREAKKHYL